MKKIASFTVNHNLLQKGIYISRVDGNIITYDIRMKKPNQGDYLSNGALHTLEHLLATYARNSAYSDKIIYVGPMGCRTGFYMLLLDTASSEDVLQLIEDAFRFIADFSGDIPGNKKSECGNYLEHDLEGAKETALDMIRVLSAWNPEKMIYKQ